MGQESWGLIWLVKSYKLPTMEKVAFLFLVHNQHPKFLETLRELVKKGQLEMMTGGYYEPILAVIPDADKVGQIKRLTQTMKMKILLKVDRKCNLWLFPLETMSFSESGLEKIFQGSRPFLHWPLELGPEKRYEVNLELKIGH